jgi:two-component system, cell cycle sensor histidine kinase and response regulator CckA
MQTKLLRPHHILIAAIFALMIAALLFVANMGMDVLTSMRAYVGGEGLWSKGQKDSVHYLLRYGKTHSESDYQRYLQSIAVPLADHDARVELQKSDPDFARVRQAFIRGRNHPADVDGMIHLFRRFRFEPHIRHAIEVWTEGDQHLQQLSQLGEDVRQELTAPTPDESRVEELLAAVESLNERFPQLEDDFSSSLGVAARYARFLVFAILAAVAALALLLGLSVSYRLMMRARDADQRYRHLFETASDAVIIADHETGLILDANAKLAELTGTPVRELLGTRQNDLFGREIPVVPGSSRFETGDLVIRHALGTSIPVDVRSNLGRFGKREVDYSVIRDIRERIRLEEQLQEVARMESVGRLVGGVAHDFNNLLTVMLGYSQALYRLTAGEAREKVGRLREAVDRAASLVRQLLAFSRKQPLQPQPLDLNQSIQSMKDMIRGVLNEQIEVVLELSPNMERAHADPRQLEQIILNLCTNARDAMPNGGKLTIRTWNAGEERVGLEIGDTGEGMDEATQSRIFEPFFTTKPLGKGFGLGLATVYGTIKQSGGEISVRSMVQKGTVFTILLRRTTRELDSPADSRAIGEVEGDETLLLVEDQPLVRQALAYGLRQQGYRVHLAGDGRQALELFERFRDEIAVVITDLVMPEMGGIALGERLRNLGAAVRIIYMTGYHQDLERYPSEELPLCGGFLLKPFTSQELAMRIRKALGSRTGAGGHLISSD